MINIHAYTENHNNYPAYVSVNRIEETKHTLTVRSRGHGGSQVGTIELSLDQMEQMAVDMLAEVSRIRETKK